MTTQLEAATDLYGQLAPLANKARLSYILDRTPAELQDEMATLIGTTAVVSNGASIAVNSAADVPLVGSPGVATVVGGVVTKVKLTS